jgi:signal transduction histidine kinase
VAELAKSSGINLVMNIEASAPEAQLVADPLRLKQILINLLGNAIKFSNGHGEVRVGLRREAEQLVFSVRDQGIGIAPEHLERIFERFEQVDKGDTRRYGGTGLGLSICRSLVELHGGRIWVESHEQAGSTFFFALPIEGPRMAVRPSLAEAPTSALRSSNATFPSLPGKELSS